LSLASETEIVSSSSKTNALANWREGAAKQAISDFVARTCDGADAVPLEERVAVFDNDGTPLVREADADPDDFILRRLVEMAEAKPELRDRQPWKGPTSATTAGSAL
jgi:hypothetical protein